MTSINQAIPVPQFMRQVDAADSKAEFGLTDRNSVTERVGSIRDLNTRVVENHGFEAKKATRDALADNTVIRNSPPRGAVVDLSV